MTQATPDALAAAEQALSQRDLPAALRLFDLAEAEGADADRCGAGRWMTHMLCGDFEPAWRESDRIGARHPDAPDRFWRGEAVDGRRVMLRCLHGFGDAVQFLRFAPVLRARARRLVVEVAPPLREIATWLPGIDQVVTWGEQAPAHPPAWDVQVEINELMYLLRVQADEVERPRPYLAVPAALLAANRPAPHQSASLKVGVVWQAGEWNPDRSVPFAALDVLFAVGGCEFWNLQGGSGRQDWSARQDWMAWPGTAFHAAESCAESLPALAATVAQLDLVIACDTLAVHLAGALGVPCWALLQHAADWRWMHGRDDPEATPWYSSVRLLRRGRHEGWAELLERVARRLSQWAGAHRRGG